MEKKKRFVNKQTIGKKKKKMTIASFLIKVMDFVPNFKGDIQKYKEDFTEDDNTNEAILLVFSRRFLNCLTPYIISDRLVFRTEFDIMLNLSDTFHFANKLLLDRFIIPDYSVQLEALRKVKHQVTRVEFTGFLPSSTTTTTTKIKSSIACHLDIPSVRLCKQLEKLTPS